MICKVLKSYGSVRHILVQQFFMRAVFIKQQCRIALSEKIRNFLCSMLFAVICYPAEQILYIIKFRHLNSPPALCDCFRMSMTVNKARNYKSALKINDFCFVRLISDAIIKASHAYKGSLLYRHRLCILSACITFIYVSVI